MSEWIQSIDIPQLVMAEAVRRVAEGYDMPDDETIFILEELINRIKTNKVG